LSQEVPATLLLYAGVVIRLGSVGSTQDEARDLPVGSVVVADEQTAGRGRLDRRWVAPPGSALLATFVVAPHPLASLAAGVAAAEACGEAVRLKWPNDLLLDGRKLGGILVEGRADRQLIGIGINLTAAPPGAARLRGTGRDELLVRVQERLAAWLASPPAGIVARWRELSDTIGRRVRVELPAGVREGLAEDIADDGALIVDGEPVHAGDVVHLHPA
jgi:BirA family transcriptional regulator, biotin operon repressor / biotin---[acetyl-CoA-carboxylase] ligase